MAARTPLTNSQTTGKKLPSTSSTTSPPAPASASSTKTPKRTTPNSSTSITKSPATPSTYSPLLSTRPAKTACPSSSSTPSHGPAVKHLSYPYNYQTRPTTSSFATQKIIPSQPRSSLTTQQPIASIFSSTSPMCPLSVTLCFTLSHYQNGQNQILSSG